MKQVPDRKKLRREYLKKKRTAFGRATFYGLGAATSGLGVLFFLFQTWFAYDHVARMALIGPGGLDPADLRDWRVYAILTFVCGLVFLACLFSGNRAEYDVKRIPYVPPITPDTLPADEILVRGSEEPPVAQSEVLLRAANGEIAQRFGLSKEELLRVAEE